MSYPWVRWLGLLAISIVLAMIIGVGYVSYREQDDAFCISCHTQPETEFSNRNLRADQSQNAEDLASFHHRKKQTRCIDCHVGEGMLGRDIVVSLAAWDAFKHYTGIARQPAVIVFPVQNEACIKCHAQEVIKPGFENHMHNKQFDGKDAVPFIQCSDCHATHRPGDEARRFQFREAILSKCEYCHTTVGKGPRGLVK
jgi:nitrate/TMAO reductase-like tetraheme cytochrome c subunit